ncbi:porin [Azohydromonas australica]|uniref:porin n=1 Tax=Azohydromonas australica TaxID=364039 RepID=UPI00048B6183|nr:porin [Azohydromonas australica]
MKPRITAMGMSVLAVVGAQAQTTPAPAAVDLYGLIDTGVERITNVGATGGSLTRMPNISGTLPSRWGLRGIEDLGGGLRAVFTLESGFGPDNGVSGQGGRLFGRQALVGLSGGWGTVALGRQYTMLFWSLLDADQLGPNVYGVGSLDAYIPNSRADNAITYRGSFSGVSVGAGYSLGRDAVNAGPSPAGTNCAGENAADKTACREWSAMVKYDSPAWGVALAADEIRGGAGAFAGLTSSALKDQRVTLNGYAKFGPVKVTAGVIRRDNDAAAPLSAVNGASARSNLYWIGGAYIATPALILDGQFYQLNFNGGGDQSTLAVLRVSYSFSKRAMVYAQAAHISNGARLAISVSSGQSGSNPVAGGSQSAVMVGVRTSF